jgi:hypothetical protein
MCPAMDSSQWDTKNLEVFWSLSHATRKFTSYVTFISINFLSPTSFAS